jgi:RHS repeat-associated protein
LSGVTKSGTGYAYENNNSRLDQVTDNTDTMHTVMVGNYDYLANSSLPAQVLSGAGNGQLTRKNDYDFLNRLGRTYATVGTSSTSPKTSTEYGLNDANQRTRAVTSDGTYWIYRYDKLGQVTSGKKFWSDGTPVAGQQFEYASDDIGNRTTTKAGGDDNGGTLRVVDYTVNSLNQYGQRSVHAGNVRGFDLIGAARGTVTVSPSATVSRRGEYFRAEITVSGGAAAWQAVSATATQSPTQVTEPATGQPNTVWVPPTPENFGHDLDGNLTSDGRFIYTWDAENRLVQVETVAGTPDSNKRRIRFELDPLGRRLRKTVYLWAGSDFSTNPNTDIKYVYDGLNLIAELDGLSSNAVLRRYTWGTDLSGTLQGAGGVGGLLSMTDQTVTPAATYFYTYDGNGNVTMLLRGTDDPNTPNIDESGTLAAQYEYGPFGETIRASGPMAKANPFRFSTKFADDEMDLVYYCPGRIYNPIPGKWLTRDPKDTLNEPNPYIPCRNDCINRMDPDGQESFATSGYGWYITVENGHWVYHNTLPPSAPSPPPPYVYYKDNNGLQTAKVSKCNVVVFYGHGIGDYYSNLKPVDFTKLTVGELNQSGVPPIVKNEPCSAAGVLGCNSGNFVRIESPIPGAPQPTYAYHGFENGPLIDQAWAAAIAQAKAICNKQGSCCEAVRVRFECPNLSWYEKPAGWCGKEEVIKCK